MLAIDGAGVPRLERAKLGTSVAASCMRFVADMSRAFPTSLRRLPLGRLLALHVDSLRRRISLAIGAKD